MSRLYDRILVNNILPKHDLYHFKSATVVSGDNVSDYYYTGTDQEIWSVERDFPNIAPPFDNFFIDIKAPKQIISEEFGTINPGENFPNYFGLWFRAFNASSIKNQINTGIFKAPVIEETIKLSNAKWFLTALFYCEKEKNKPIGPSIYWFLAVTKEGNIEVINNKVAFRGGLLPFSLDHEEYLKSLSFDQYEEIFNDCSPFLHVGLLTISFMHCKNIIVKTVEPPAKLQKKHIKNKKFPLVRYHVLDIEPMKTVLRTEGNIEKVGLKKALHICRGHFKDYTQGKGLFGRTKGLFWWDMHIRGNKEEGIINKDYNIKT